MASAILSDPSDAEIVIRYVKDLEALARREVGPSPTGASEQATDRTVIIADFLKVAYALDLGEEFQELLDRFDKDAGPPN
ncbi:hypothetical protein [Novosphingobium cyanobacteriorum]|uniref:Uncharacterized protein n=1 Tax=Novosphingobium cyanobacteriorum TaxID=3024215 RepID=A0ABT6CNN7_9SPHN|nr:hypothetical protein [Novosphingobium cyanobacteriorum]MDF8335198.1 hypothetical protein [Novosphingobium cyanobacteriorum]